MRVQFNMWKMLSAVAMALALTISPASAGSEPAEIRHAKVGEVILLKLPGDPNAGYRWQVSTDRSTGLDLVRVDQVGWIMGEPGQSMFFKKESFLNVAIHANGAGIAEITFEYWRATANPQLIRSTTARVVIGAKQATR